jgi:hypothetical protein
MLTSLGSYPGYPQVSLNFAGENRFVWYRSLSLCSYRRNSLSDWDVSING